MKLSSILNNLSYGELSQHHIGTSDSGLIADEDVPAIVSHIQLGLNNIYSRFLVKRRQLILSHEQGINTYLLDSMYAKSNTASNEPIKYIEDENDPFTNDLIRIEEATNTSLVPIPLNDENMSGSAYTPTYNQFQFPVEYNDTHAILVYRANHPKLTATNMAEANNEELELSDIFQEALMSYVYGRVLQAQGGQETTAESVNHFRRYESLIRQLRLTNAFSSDMPTNHKMEARGWV